MNGDVVTTLLQDVFTQVEKAMIEDGRNDAVLVTHAVAERDRAMFLSAVGEAMGRSVRAAISGFDAVHEIATEVLCSRPSEAITD